MINDDLTKKRSPHFREKYLVLSYLKEVNCSFGSGLGVHDRVGLGLVFDSSPIPIFGCVKRAPQAVHLLFAFSPRYGTRSIL